MNTTSSSLVVSRKPRRFEITVREIGSDDNVIVTVPALEFQVAIAANDAASISEFSHSDISQVITNGLLESNCQTAAQNQRLLTQLAHAQFKSREANVDA